MEKEIDLKAEILKEHSSRQATFIAKWALSNQSNFEALLLIFQTGDFIIAQRAGYAILKTFDLAPKKFEPYLTLLFHHIRTPNQHIAVKRNIFRMFETSQIPDEIEDELFDMALSFLQDKSEADAIRSTAIIVSVRIAKKYPELLAELKQQLDDELPYAKPSFISRYKRAFGKK